MEVRYFKFTVPMLKATAGALVEFDIPNSALSSARILGFRIVAPKLPTATRGTQNLGFGWRPGDNFIEAFGVAASNPVDTDLTLTYGAHIAEAPLVFQGDLSLAVGDENVPLKLYYSNGTDADQTVDIPIEVVVGYEVI